MIKSIEKLSKNTYVISALILIAVLNILAYLHQQSVLCLGIFLLSICFINCYTENLTYGILLTLMREMNDRNDIFANTFEVN